MCCWERPGPRPRALLHAALECIAPFGDADDRAGLTRGDKFGHISPDASPSGPLARQRSSQPTQQHTMPHRCEVRRRIQRARTGFEARGLVQTNFAHNFSRSLFETTRKRCNPNDTTSISKQVAGELRAKLLRRWQDPSQTNFACNSIGTNFNKPRKRCNSNDANSMFEQAAGELHAKLMIDSHNWATYNNPGPGRGAGGRWRGLAGLRGAAPNEVRPPSLAGGRGLRRPEHRRRHTQQPHDYPGTPKGRVPKYPPLVGSLSHCLVEAQAE